MSRPETIKPVLELILLRKGGEVIEISQGCLEWVSLASGLSGNLSDWQAERDLMAIGLTNGIELLGA